MEKRSGDPLRIFVLLYRERVRLSSPQRGKKSLVQRTFFRDFIKTAHRGCGAQYSLSRNLVAFAPAGAKKVRSFSSATCAAKIILLRLQVWNLCAGGAQIMRAADCNPFCQKGFLFDSLKRRLSRFRDRRLVFGMGSFGAFGCAQRSELVAALVLPVHCQLAISGRSTPCAAIYCRCSTSLSRICCTA